MVPERGKHLPLGCRYVPYDQWFITHIDSTWKIKHLKQRIISKCLNLPFDPRSIQNDVTPNARPPSPITFAPRPDTPVEYSAPGDVVGGDDQESAGGAGADEGYEGYEEDDEWEQDFDIRGGKVGPSNAKSRSKTLTTPSSINIRLQQQKRKQKQEPQITTHTYTLFRYSTGQILEEEFQISWYNIQPHELVELHSSLLPLTFSSSLVSPISLPPSSANNPAAVTSMPNQKKKRSSATTPDRGGLPVISVTPLPRQIPNLYIQPYWQGWVRALRVLWRVQTVRPIDEHLRSLLGDGRERPEAKLGQRVEWRERWVVIQDGFINIFRSPTDPNPNRLPFSSLKALRGPEYLAHSVYTKNGTRKPLVPSKARTPDLTTRAPTSTTTTVGSSHTRIHPRSNSSMTPDGLPGPKTTKGIQERAEVPGKEEKLDTHSLKKSWKDEKQQLSSPPSSPSLPGPGQARQPHPPYPSTSTSTSIPASTSVTSKAHLAPAAEDRERERRKALERREAREKAERELETLKKWDDLGFSFSLGGKDKSKDKAKDKSKGQEREREREREREKDRERELRWVSSNRDTSRNERRHHHHQHKDERGRNHTKYFYPGDEDKSQSSGDKTFIPTSREEAEQAGMKVVCAKFRVGPSVARELDKGTGDTLGDGFPKMRRYTSTGPSLALIASGANTKQKASAGPHIVLDADGHVCEPPEDCASESYDRQPPPRRRILTGSSRSTIHSSSTTTITTTSAASTATITAVGTDAITTSPISHVGGLPWNVLGGTNDKENPDDKEPIATERRRTAEDLGTAAMEDGVLVIGRQAPASKPEKETNEIGCAADPANVAALSHTRPTVIIPSSPTPIITSDVPQITNFPGSQVGDSPHSDSSSSISISSPVFAHSIHESDLDDDAFLNYGPGGRTAVSGGNRPRAAYRYGGHHIEVQAKKWENEKKEACLVGGAGSTGGDVGVGKEAGMEDRRKEKDQGNDGEREEWIVLDMINDNAFNSILRILHRHSPSPVSSSFTSSQTGISSPPISPHPGISNKPKANPLEDLFHGSETQVIPSDAEDIGGYVKSSAASNKTIHPPILESLAPRTILNLPHQRPFSVALPYPEWRLELVNRARRAGMREIGRPLDLALHGWGREFEEMAVAARERKFEREKEWEKEIDQRRMSAQSQASTIKQRERRPSRVLDGSDADDDDDSVGDEDDGDEEGIMGTTRLDSDGEEESDTEWLAWMTDLPRQFLVQQAQATIQPVQNPSSILSDPFSSPPLADDGGGPVRPPRTQEEERLLHADKLRKLEPSAISTVNSPTSPVDPVSTSSSPESSNHQHGPSHNSTPFPGFQSIDDLPASKGSYPRPQSRSLQHLRRVGPVPEEVNDGYAAEASSSSGRQGLYHSASVDQHLSSKKSELDSPLQHKSTASEGRKQYPLGKPILSSEQIKQIESEVIASAPNSSLPSHWKVPPMPVSSPLPLPPSSSSPSYTPSHTPSTSTSTSTIHPSITLSPAVSSANVSGSGEVKGAPVNPALNRFTPSDLGPYSSSVGMSLSTPSSPSASIAVSPNSTSPPRSSVFGSLGWTPGKVAGGQEKEKKGFLLKKRMSRDLGKDKERERDAGESVISPAASANQRHKLSTSTPSPSSFPTPHRNHAHDISSPTPPNNTTGHHTMSSARALLRRVRSGSSLRGEESTNISFSTISPTPAVALAAAETEGKEVQKKKKGPIDRIVRGFDSSLAFAEGR